MQIRRINVTGHVALGNCEIDFCDEQTGSPYSTVIIAGENGTGKSALLLLIYEALSERGFNLACESLHIGLALDRSNINEMRKQLDFEEFEPVDGLVHLSFSRHYQGHHPHNLEVSWQNIEGTNFTRRGNEIFSGSAQKRLPLRAFFNEAITNFGQSSINTASALDLDLNTHGSRLNDGQAMSKQFAQLLVDLRAADSDDVSDWIASHPGQAVPMDIVHKRLHRFQESIAYMFPNKRLLPPKREGGVFHIRFEENGRSTDINNLSTGEKQIVYRGGFVLRERATVQGGLLLLDEPELGLSPIWQSKILGFYRRLFLDTSECTTQLLVTTHSPFIVHDHHNAKIVILKKDANGNTYADDDEAYPTVGAARLSKAFNADAILPRIDAKTILLVEGTTDKQIIECAWQKLYQRPMDFAVQVALSHNAIKATLNDGQVFTKNPDKNVIGLFDFDSGFNEWNGVWKRDGLSFEEDPKKCLGRKHASEKGWSLLLPVPESRRFLASKELGALSCMSIELLFEDKQFLPNMITQRPLPYPGATRPSVSDKMKQKFANHVATLEAAAFANFIPIFEKIRQIMDGK